MERSGKFDKYFLFDSPPNVFHPPGSFPGTEMFVMEDKLIKGAPRLMVAWYTGPWTIEETYKPHGHNHDEVLMFLGSDYENPRELGGEVEFWMEDDQYLLTKSCSIYVPKGLRHAPMRPTRVDDPGKPILFAGFVATNDEPDFTYHSRNPKFSQYKDPLPIDGEIRWLD